LIEGSLADARLYSKVSCHRSNKQEGDSKRAYEKWACMVPLHTSVEYAALDWPATGDIDSGDAYARYAELYDALHGDLVADAQFYLTAARAHVAKTEKILELGVGTGRLTAHLLNDGHHVVGVDSSEEMIARAAEKFGDNVGLELQCADVRGFALDYRTFPLAIAPYGMTAHLLTDADRVAAFRCVYAHLRPGGAFIFDDCPSWMGGAEEDTALHVSVVHDDPSGGKLRLMTNTIEAADEPLSVRYDIIDRLNTAGHVRTRTIVRVVFRNIALKNELSLLAQAGFTRVDALGGFDGRTLDEAQPTLNSRLILRCYRDA
jgi:SAM-dependent methyltransferase